MHVFSQLLIASKNSSQPLVAFPILDPVFKCKPYTWPPSLWKKFLFSLPKELRNQMKALLNIENEEYEYFIWYLVRFLNTVNKNPVKIRNVDTELEK